MRLYNAQPHELIGPRYYNDITADAVAGAFSYVGLFSTPSAVRDIWIEAVEPLIQGQPSVPVISSGTIVGPYNPGNWQAFGNVPAGPSLSQITGSAAALPDDVIELPVGFNSENVFVLSPLEMYLAPVQAGVSFWTIAVNNSIRLKVWWRELYHTIPAL